MSKNKDSQQFDSRSAEMSAEQRLAIQQEVEKRVTDPPSSTWRNIQQAITEKISEKERTYAVIAASVVIIAGIFGWNLNDSFKQIQNSYLKLDQAVQNSLPQVAYLTNRIQELSTNNNIVTRQRLHEELKVVEDLRFEAEEALFNVTLVAAEAGDGLAFDRLTRWSTNITHRLSARAQKSINNLLMSWTGPFQRPMDPSVVQSRVTTQWDLTAGFERANATYLDSLPEARLSVIETIGTATNFSRADRLKFLIKVATSDSIIYGRRRAVELLQKDMDLPAEFAVWESDRINLWSSTNSPEIK